jgi:ABC-type nitrate/sulfonate/bicarbonate transport system substrate-binding protein
MKHSRSGLRTVAVLVAFLVSLGVTACGSSPSTPTATTKSTQHITMLLPYLNELDASQYYFANDFGYFKQCGLSVKLQPGAGVPDPGAALLEGKAQFAVLDPLTYISGVSRGLPYIAISEDTAHSGISYVSLASSGITSPRDLPGKTVALQQGDDNLWYLQYIMSKYLTKQQQSRVHIVPGGYNNTPLLAHRVDVYSEWSDSNDLVAAELRGLKFNVMAARNYGIYAMGDVVVVTKKLLQQDPGLVARFDAAINAGLGQYTLQNAKHGVQSTEARLSPKVSTRILTAQWPEVIALDQSSFWKQHGMGTNDPAAYQQVQNFLLANHKISAKLPMSRLYTNQIIDRIYHNGQLQIANVCQGPKGGTYSAPTS